jgi:hypothetical protein
MMNFVNDNEGPEEKRTFIGCGPVLLVVAVIYVLAALALCHHAMKKAAPVRERPASYGSLNA